LEGTVHALRPVIAALFDLIFRLRSPLMTRVFSFISILMSSFESPVARPS
jgi:hypothetical protein